MNLDLEDGEVAASTPGTAYDPAFEWPGEESTATTEDTFPPQLDGPLLTSHFHSHTPIRLLVTQTSILPRKQKLVIPDSDHNELQFGRDVPPSGSETPRVRLKEMEVSKVHATIYWDQEQKGWGIVDMGSKHGTFIKSSVVKPVGTVSLDLGQGQDRRGSRLSPPKVASIPRRLRHLDSVSIGSTTFLAHIHDNRQPCVDCSPSPTTHEVSLFNASKRDQDSLKRSSEAAGFSQSQAYTPMTLGPRDPKKALTMLKRSLLTQHGGTLPPAATNDPGSAYVDRSARRRALHPGSRPDVPGAVDPRRVLPTILPYHQPVVRQLVRPSSSLVVQPPQPPPPPAPLSTTNIGHKLLMKQGWQPGTSLGLPDDDSGSGSPGGLIEPIQVSANVRRAGLGMPQAAPQTQSTSSSSSDWRENGKRRRWDGITGDV